MWASFGPLVPLSTFYHMSSRALIKKANLEKRNARIREQFRKQYTDQPKPRKRTRDQVVAQLVEDFCLSLTTIERIVYTQDSAATPAAA